MDKSTGDGRKAERTGTTWYERFIVHAKNEKSVLVLIFIFCFVSVKLHLFVCSLCVCRIMAVFNVRYDQRCFENL